MLGGCGSLLVFPRGLYAPRGSPRFPPLFSPCLKNCTASFTSLLETLYSGVPGSFGERGRQASQAFATPPFLSLAPNKPGSLKHRVSSRKVKLTVQLLKQELKSCRNLGRPPEHKAPWGPHSAQHLAGADPAGMLWYCYVYTIGTAVPKADNNISPFFHLHP